MTVGQSFEREEVKGRRESGRRRRGSYSALSRRQNCAGRLETLETLEKDFLRGSSSSRKGDSALEDSKLMRRFSPLSLATSTLLSVVHY